MHKKTTLVWCVYNFHVSWIKKHKFYFTSLFSRAWKRNFDTHKAQRDMNNHCEWERNDAMAFFNGVHGAMIVIFFPLFWRRPSFMLYIFSSLNSINTSWSFFMDFSLIQKNIIFFPLCLLFCVRNVIIIKNCRNEAMKNCNNDEGI